MNRNYRKVEVPRELSEIKNVMEKIIGDEKATEIMVEIVYEKQELGIDGIELIRKMLEAGAEPEKIRRMLGIDWGLEQNDVQKILEVSMKPEEETDANIPISQEKDESDEDADGTNYDSLLKSDVLSRIDDEID
ncbi:hypothetical protein BMS3Bbin15_01427 [archaeon BMS3Bbin15]|nr:hypothetical protein BMS3Bbin15_01427 [archaeon BMS3Bbin15]